MGHAGGTGTANNEAPGPRRRIVTGRRLAGSLVFSSAAGRHGSATACAITVESRYGRRAVPVVVAGAYGFSPTTSAGSRH